MSFYFKTFVFLLFLSSGFGFCVEKKNPSLSLNEYLNVKDFLEEFSTQKRSLLEKKIKLSFAEFKRSLKEFKEGLFQKLSEGDSFKKKL